MSQKQSEHYRNYHLENLNLNDNENEVVDEKNYDEKDNLFKNTVWQDLAEFRKKLSIYDPHIIKSYIRKNLNDDVAEIREQFNNEFKNIPNDDILKREVMVLLGELGITIYHTKKRE